MHCIRFIAQVVPTSYRILTRITTKMDQEIGQQFVRLKQTKDYSQCQKSINALISLLNNNRLWAEYTLMKKMTPKIAIRLRNSPYSRSLEQLSKVATEFKAAVETKSPFEEMKVFFESELTEGNIDQVQSNIEVFLNQMQSLAQKLFLMTVLSQKAFKLAQLWLDLGQLVNHFLMISCVTSRICVYCKSLLVYLYDVYQMTRKLQKVYLLTEGIADRDHIKPYLQKLNIKLRSNIKGSNSRKQSTASIRSETIGALTSKEGRILLTYDDDDGIIDGEVSTDFGDRDSFNKKVATPGGNSAIIQVANSNQQKKSKGKRGGDKGKDVKLTSTKNNNSSNLCGSGVNKRGNAQSKKQKNKKGKQVQASQTGKQSKPSISAAKLKTCPVPAKNQQKNRKKKVNQFKANK